MIICSNKGAALTAKHSFNILNNTTGTVHATPHITNIIRNGIEELDPVQVHKAINVTCFGAFLVAQEATKRMLERKSGSIFFTGATAGVKGFANSSAFAMGKFGLRGLAQSLARELHPKNIHIGHFVIDGGIGKKPMGDYQMINPDEIAKTYLDFYNQDKSAWSWEIELRTSVEKF